MAMEVGSLLTEVLFSNVCEHQLFKSSNINLINEYRLYFNFQLPSELLIKRKDNFIEKFMAD